MYEKKGNIFFRSNQKELLIKKKGKENIKNLIKLRSPKKYSQKLKDELSVKKEQRETFVTTSQQSS